jgi:signal transduction histidine kinase
VRLGLQSLLAGTLPENKRSNYLQAMLGEVDRLEYGLSNVLAAAGLPKVQAKPILEVGDLAGDVRASIAAVQVRAATAQVELTVGDLPRTELRRDASGVRRALTNVLDNAIKFSAPRAAVRVALRRTAGGAVLSVADSGIGVAKEDLPHLGERFYRGRNSVHRGGSGLGLFLARELVQGSGGTLVVASAGEGKGCVVEIALPGDAA